ncbi:MAG: hypothetical protein GXY58_12285 [Planctomycetaceae bacterium]|nr:hypothetical protein [Planctomycetaceae bacterium]
MKHTPPLPAVRCILVALDDACSDHETMETAARLAADLQAELQGLYVEDVNALRLAALPFTQEITTASGVARRIDPESMERAMQNKAAHVRQLLERSAARAHIRCSFSVTRGHVTQRALLATGETDLVLFGSRSHAPATRLPAAAPARSAVRPVVAVLDAAAPRIQTLDTAVAISQRQQRGLVVLVRGAPPGAVELCADRVRDRLADRDVNARVSRIPIDTLADLIRAAHTHGAALLLLSRTCRLLDQTAVHTLLENLDCPIVLG